MKPWLLLALLLAVAIADDEPPKDDEQKHEYAFATEMKDEDVGSTDKLIRLLRDGDQELMDVTYVIGIWDSTNKEIPQKDWSKTMLKKMECFKWADVQKDKDEDEEKKEEDNPPPTDDDKDKKDDSVLYTADECKEQWAPIKDWEKDSL